MASALGCHRVSMLATQPRIFHRSAAKRLAASGLWSQRRISAIFYCKFLTLFGVIGSLAGSLLCFVKCSLFVLRSFIEYFNAIWQGVDNEVILLLVEATWTVMGLYELFVSTLDIPEENLPAGVPRTTVCGSNLFGLFRLQERPKWLEIRSLDELKTKLGHVIVMILLVGMFEKIVIHTGLDLVCLSASILFSSGCLFLLSKLHNVRLADSGHSSQLWMLIPDLLAREVALLDGIQARNCLWIEPLPSAMQADVLTFVQLRSYRFRPNDLLLLSKRLLVSGENLDFWVRRAAQTLLGKCSQSSNSKEASDLDEIPDSLKKHWNLKATKQCSKKARNKNSIQKTRRTTGT
ncbi:hypothetical protein SELMODRAFT_406519 [Selaginella moellendorffii]|uniref:Uncharacterized protein n=1 Tax=Selaginella moellendorffii TaxID=88036 RepID=D8R2M9_SELML|nr:hypothetical protein SELMODRAFT_406519 [Selaginella moellendorffii]